MYFKGDFFGTYDTHTFYSIPLRIPRDSDSYLKMLYGECWQTPQKNRFAGPRGLLSQYINRLFVDFTLPHAFTGDDANATYKPWASKLLKRFFPNAKLTQLFKHPE